MGGPETPAGEEFRLALFRFSAASCLSLAPSLKWSWATLFSFPRSVVGEEDAAWDGTTVPRREEGAFRGAGVEVGEGAPAALVFFFFFFLFPPPFVCSPPP